MKALRSFLSAIFLISLLLLFCNDYHHEALSIDIKKQEKLKYPFCFTNADCPSREKCYLTSSSQGECLIPCDLFESNRFCPPETSCNTIVQNEFNEEIWPWCITNGYQKEGEECDLSESGNHNCALGFVCLSDGKCYRWCNKTHPCTHKKQRCIPLEVKGEKIPYSICAPLQMQH